MQKLPKNDHRIIYILSLQLYLLGQVLLAQEKNAIIRFTENKNQWPSSILYRAQLDGGNLFLEKNAFVYNFYDKDELHSRHIRTVKSLQKEKPLRFHAYKITFVGASAQARCNSLRPTVDYCNFYIGSDPSYWASRVRNYQEVVYHNLYSGIDMQLLGEENSMKYNFLVSKGADPGQIAMHYEGVEKLQLKKGKLVITTSLFEITEHEPIAWQLIDGKKKMVPCEFVLKNNTLSFRFPEKYDNNYALVIDPLLVFACSSGSTADNFGMTATYDSKGNLYSGGTAFNAGYPVTLGAYDDTYNGIAQPERTDVVITKYDAIGTFLQYSTYLGGAISTEIVTSLVVDQQDNLFLYGATGSPDFPVTANAYDKTFNGGKYIRFYQNGTKYERGTDIYVSKFNDKGTQLLASTFIGGDDSDGVNHNNDSVLIGIDYQYPYDSLQYNYSDQYRGEIQVDKAGNCYISSSTRSKNFPVVNAYDNSLGGRQDAVAFKFNATLSTLIWSTYIGGKDNDAGYALVVNDSSEVYITGGTRSTDFPTTNGVVAPAYNGGKADGFIAHLSKDGKSLLHATYLGTNLYDQSYFIQNDRKGNIYVLGQSLGSMPVQNVTYSNANGKQFICKLNPGLTNLIYSTVIGSGGSKIDISPSAFLIDYCEKIYLSGWGGNINTNQPTSGMPLTSNAVNPTTDGFNFYLMVLDKDAASLIYGSYFGGGQSQEHVDGGTSRFDKKGIIYQSVCAGCGGNDDFPVTSGSWPNTGANVNHSSNCNNGTFKFDFQIPLVEANFSCSQLQGCAPVTVNFSNNSTSGSHFLWDFGNNDTTSLIASPIKTFSQPGTYIVKLFVTDPAKCNLADSTYTIITVYPAIQANFNFTVDPCAHSASFQDASISNAQQWNWSFGDGQSSVIQSPTHTYGAAGNYTVNFLVTNTYGCKDSIKKTLTIPPFVPVAVNASQIICPGKSAQLNASGGIAYAWSPTGSLNFSNIANPIASPLVNTTYTVNITTVNTTGDICHTQVTTTVNMSSLSGPQQVLQANPDTVIKGSSSNLSSSLASPYTITWSPPGTLNNPNSFTPVATPLHTTTYTAMVTDASGCTYILDPVTVYVITSACNESVVFVPNTFTPNNDGSNDVLYVRSHFIQEIYFAVYNRWGQLVFETNEQTKGWDGIYNGMKADPGVFGYYLKVKCNNGEESFKKGNITLIR